MLPMACCKTWPLRPTFNFENMDSTPNAHPYVALDSRSREIRLLELSPNEFPSDIECHLIHVSLHDSPQYEALSYCWGNPVMTRPISLDGHRFLATESAELALRYLRYQDKSRVLWIDALCIYSDRTRIKPRRNLRLGASIFWGVWLACQIGECAVRVLK
jgi:hypothetical protein